MPQFPETIHETTERRTVVLGRDFDVSYSDYSEETLLRMTSSHAYIIRFNEVEEPEKIKLSASEMDALVAAWPAFKAHMQAQKEEKQQALAEAERKARDLLTGSDLELKKDQTGKYYEIWSKDGSRYRKGYIDPENVLEAVQEYLDSMKSDEAPF